MPRCKHCKKNYERQYPMQVACSIKCMIALKKDKIQNIKRQPIKPMSDKRKNRLCEYYKLREDFLLNKICPVTGKQATEIHHTNGRENDRLNDMKHWLAVSRTGHEWIHAHPKEAREAGWLV